MSFDPDRNSFQQDYDAQKKRREMQLRQKVAAQNTESPLKALQRENALLRKRLARRESQLNQIKGVAVHMRTQAGKLSNVTPQILINLSTDILKLINGK